mgnify:CR=1 FL=1
MWVAFEKLSGAIVNATNDISLIVLVVIGFLMVGAAALPLAIKKQSPWLAGFIFSLLGLTVIVSLSLIFFIKKELLVSPVSVRPRASVTKNPAPINSDYILWIDGVASDTSIVGVDYQFNDKTATLPRRSSYLSQNGYAVSYRGSYCYSNVSILIHRRDGSKSNISYNMCDDTRE